MKYILIIFILCSCSKNIILVPGNGAHFPHKCKFKECPYKGLYKKQWSDSVANYTKSKFGDDAHAIDMVHLLKPKWSYEQIKAALLID